jgi:hypothetical protein
MVSVSVIDADGHVMETEAMWAALEPRYEAWRPRWVPDPMGVPRVLIIEGIDVAILYPTLGLAVRGFEDAGFATAFCHAYNDWVAAYCQAAAA